MQQLTKMGGVDFEADGMICMRMMGDGMVPAIEPREWFIVDKRATTFSPAGMFLVADHGTFDVVCLDWRPDLGKVVQTRKNKAYSEQHLDPDRVCVVGRVVGVVKRVG